MLKLAQQVEASGARKNVMPVFALLTQILQDAQKSTNAASKPTTVETSKHVTQYQTVTANGAVLTSYSYGPQEESIYNTT